MKKSLLISLLLGCMISLSGAKVSNTQCDTKGDGYFFAGGECIQFVEFEGEKKSFLNIIVHGTWKEGTNILARYAPFAETINMNTDITTVAIALPGYSNSSTNNFLALSHKGIKHLSANKKYIEFLGSLVLKLKNKYNANTVTYIGHSAGAMIGATLSGLKPNLINNFVLAGGIYNLDKIKNKSNFISIDSFVNNLNKKTKYLLIYGTKDQISPAKNTIDFYKIAKNNNLDVKLIKVEDAPHLDLDMSDASVDAITDMLDN
jgi:pimeloyl-ACP methyl ester carboxylesterase